MVTANLSEDERRTRVYRSDARKHKGRTTKPYRGNVRRGRVLPSRKRFNVAARPGLCRRPKSTSAIYTHTRTFGCTLTTCRLKSTGPPSFIQTTTGQREQRANRSDTKYRTRVASDLYSSVADRLGDIASTFPGRQLLSKPGP